MCAQLKRFAVVGVALVLTAVPVAHAQEPASSIDQLRVLVRPGDSVRITGEDGRERKGTIAGLSLTSLALKEGDRERVVMESEIRTIRQRQDDSLADGARNGFIVGAIVGLLTALSISSEVESTWFIPFATGLYGGFGAGVGAGIDAMITSDRVIYDSGWKRKALTLKLVSW